MARECQRSRFDKRFGRPTLLADTLCAAPFRMPGWGSRVDAGECEIWRNLGSDVVVCLPACPVICVSNVSEYFFNVSDQEYWTAKDFPVCSPPFSEFFMECERPSSVISKEYGVRSATGMPDRWGWHFRAPSTVDAVNGFLKAADESDDEEELQLIIGRARLAGMSFSVDAIKRAVLAGPMSEAVMSLNRFEAAALTLAVRSQARGLSAESLLGSRRLSCGGWQVDAVLFAQVGRHASGPLGTASIPIAKDGSISDTIAFSVFGQHSLPAEEVQGYADLLYVFLQPFLLALSFLNCARSSLRVVDPDAAKNRLRARHGVKPLLRYHIIEIEAMKELLRTDGSVETVGLRKALHICRGHFATYTEDRPLFGKHAGTFWVPAHVRGRSENGVVVSDYRVNCPSND